MKKTLKMVLMILFSATLAVGIAGCSSSTSTTTPEEAIINAFGDKQYKITFDATDLNEPLADMYFSATSMPTLPTPEKVGYVFAGWYFDSSLTDYCDVTNNDLLWKVGRNITLYPKWEKESIESNGTYEIEYKAEIVEGSIVKGIYAEKYGWRNFADDIVASGTYIEKNDNGTFLRIQYDCHERGPIFDGTDFAPQTYTVEDLENRINDELSIFDRTSSTQTLYYDISGLELDEIITLNIDYLNYNIDDDETRTLAKVSYKVEFIITRFIGYTQSFVNTEGKLDDGVYMLPTHYTGLDKSAAMLDSFHPVYAYIIAEKGNYTLVKPLSAYNSDINGNLSGDAYFNSSTGYARDFTCFLTDQSNVYVESDNSDDYIPEKLNAKSYCALTYEFHADTGRYYYTVDLGNTLTNDVILFGGSTGAMEQMMSLAFKWRRLCLNYDGMVRISDWDYEEISGDSFSYKTQSPFYAGYTSADFSDSNADFDLLQTTSLAVRMVNLFFASNNGGKTGNAYYSTKMTISPTTKTAAGSISDMRYSFSTFDIIYEAFGYNAKADGNLYSHAISYLALFTPNAVTDSDIVKVDVGKTIAEGDLVNLTDLYLEKVYPSATAVNLSWQGYELDKDGDADFTKPVTLENEFTFEKGVAIYYTSKETNSTRTSLVILQPEEKAVYTVGEDKWTYDKESGVYTSSERYKIGDYATVPEITWTVLDRSYTTRSLKKYDTDTAWTNFLYVAVWEYSNGVYNRVYATFTDNLDNYNVFEISASVIVVEVRLYNRFGEFESIFFEYRSNVAGDYEIFVDDETRAVGDLTYTANVRNPVAFEEVKADEIVTEGDLTSLPTEYSIRITDSDCVNTQTLPLTSVTVYLKGDTKTVKAFEEAWALIDGQNYAVVSIIYADDYGDMVTRTAVYGFTVEIKSITEYEFFDGGNDIFTGEEFEFENPKIAGANYSPLVRPYALCVYRLSGSNWVRTTSSEDYINTATTYSTTISFNREGMYLLCWNYSFRLDGSGNKIFAAYENDADNAVSVYWGRVVTVNDKNCDITITYVTDSEHPFDTTKLSDVVEENGYQYYTTTVSMLERNISLSYYDFILPDGTKDQLYGWGSSWNFSDRLFSADSNIGSLGVTLHSLTPVVYALWDKGITVSVYIEKDGNQVQFSTKTYTYYRPTTKAGNYTVQLSTFGADYNSGAYTNYQIAMWKADKAVFRIIENGKYAYYDTFELSDQSKAFTSSLDVTDDLTLTLVLRKKLIVSYQAVDEDGNKLDLATSLGADRSCLEGYTLASKITESKLDKLNSVTCTDETKEFKYWAVMVDGKLVKFDIETDVFTSEHFGNLSTVVLYAVFGDKEA